MSELSGPTAPGPWEILSHVWQLTTSLMDEAAPALEALGVHPKALFLMAALEHHACPAQLARALNLPPPTVTYIVKALEAKGYVNRRPVPADLRKFRIALTPRGREALSMGQRKVAEVFAARLGRLSAEEVAALDRSLARLTPAQSPPQRGSKP